MILSFKRISTSYLDFFLLKKSKKSNKRKRPPFHDPLPGLKDLGLYQEQLGFNKRFFEAFFKKLLDVQTKVDNLNLTLKKNLGYKVDEASFSFTKISEINLNKIIELKDMYPFFNRISILLNDCLVLINTFFDIRLQTSVSIHSSLDMPKAVIHHFNHSLLVTSMLLNGFFEIDPLDPLARENPYFCQACQACQAFKDKNIHKFFEIKGLLDKVYLELRQDISPLYTDILKLKTQLILMQ